MNADQLGALSKRLGFSTASSTAAVAKHLCVGRKLLELLLEASRDVSCTSEVAVHSYDEAPQWLRVAREDCRVELQPATVTASQGALQQP